MRSLLVFLFTLGFLFASGKVPAQVTASFEKSPARTINRIDTTVYITRTGTRYHREGCRYLRQSSIPISLSNARKNYLPCKVCRPPE